ncbi:MAG: metallophosphatase family protein [Proteobacteria bacterium]|nr:metallophosphatase family protein [Pseudomonadota bacterium]
MIRIGLISDTHGLLRPEAVSFLAGSDLILHGGDIGGPQILDELRRIAPVTAVRGNNDHGDWAQAVREFERIEVGEHGIYLLHDLARLDIDPQAAGVRVVVSGHSHVPSVVERERVWFVNPGSAGPRRFKLPVAAGELCIENARVSARTVVLIE